MLFLLLCACGVSISESCEVTATTLIADDEASPFGLSAEEALAVGAGSWTMPGALEDDTPVTATLESVRSGGSATFIESELVSTKHLNGTLWGESSNSMLVICVNQISVPITLSVSSDDGSVAYSEAGTLTVSDADLDRIALDSSIAPDGEVGLPPVDEEGIEEAFAQADIVDGGTLISGNAGWQGSTETSAWARYMLTFEMDGG